MTLDEVRERLALARGRVIAARERGDEIGVRVHTFAVEEAEARLLELAEAGEL